MFVCDVCVYYVYVSSRAESDTVSHIHSAESLMQETRLQLVPHFQHIQ